MSHIGLWTTNTIPSGISITIPTGQMKIIYGDLTLQGRLTIRAGGVLALLDGQLVLEGGVLDNQGTLVEKMLASEEYVARNVLDIFSIQSSLATTNSDIAQFQNDQAQNNTAQAFLIQGIQTQIDTGIWPAITSLQNAISTLQGRVDALETQNQDQETLIGFLLTGQE